MGFRMDSYSFGLPQSGYRASMDAGRGQDYQRGNREAIKYNNETGYWHIYKEGELWSPTGFRSEWAAIRFLGWTKPNAARGLMVLYNLRGE
jgi:hypothetical protein